MCVALAKAKPRNHGEHQGRQPFSMPAHRAQHHPQCLQMFVGHIPQPKAQAALDAAKFARRVRRRLGLSQAEFSERIDVSLETIRNWEQGKRSPTGAAMALLKILDKAPEAALAALR